ncbi:MAG TPA: CDP-alcohol phosphatidyltransferase family protein [Rubricoccaceae bacterium]|nr:CDP-alcohol phosphatidyltransferase family protein [Rubricoccaceae bacterium]
MKHVPNALTLSRIVAAPLCLWGLATGTFTGQLLGTALFIAAAITDYWDGRLARQYGVGSRLGQFLDPLADKVLVLGAFFLIPFLDPLGRALAAPVGAWLPWAAILAVAARDLAVTALRTVYERRNRPLRTTSAAKWKTAWQLTFLITVEVFLVFSHARVLGGFWGAFGRFFYAVLESPFPLVFLVLTAAVTVYTGVRYFARPEPAPPVPGEVAPSAPFDAPH